MWRVRGDSGNFWLKQSVSPDKLPQEQPFQLIIEGRVYDDEQGDLAIDDIVLSSDCRCVRLVVVFCYDW